MKHNFGVKAKLLTSFIVFSVLVVALLWLLEVVFLDDIYRSIKINSVRSTAESMHRLSDSELQNLMSKKSSSIGLCVSVYDVQFDTLVEEHTNGQCVVHNLSKKNVKMFYEATREFKTQHFESLLPAEEIMEILKRNEESLSFYPFSPGYFRGEEPALSASSDAYDCVLFSQIFYNDNNEERYALISAVLLPVDATIQTIRFELNLVIAALIIISVIMSYVLSRTISGPIVALNKASKSLPDGYFEGQNIKGYREVEELADTLSKASVEIQQVDRLRKELVANVSHDLRTPLTLISGYSEVMRDIPGENTAENLQVVIDESRRLSELVTDLLDLSKLEAGMEKITPEPIELVSFVRKILERYEKMTGFQGYSIRFESASDEVLVFADTVKLNQIIYNLVNNAINYCGEDKFVAVKLFLAGEKAVIEVIDHGEGIPEEKLSEIWDRYYRVDKNHRTAVVGTGLGLSIVKKLLTLHKAQFGVRSTLGKGSVFWFALDILPSPK